MQPIAGLSIPCVYYIKQFLNETQDDLPKLYEHLRTSVKWEKTTKINRWVALFGDVTKPPPATTASTSTSTTSTSTTSSYRYRDQPSKGLQPWSDELLSIKKKIETYYHQHTGKAIEFNVCLLNMYENGQQAIGWHADREEIGRSTPIASISLGAARRFLIKSKTGSKNDSSEIKLEHGSLTIMENICQHEYLHSVPKEKNVTKGRINLTFRCKLEGENTEGEKLHERRENLNFLTEKPDGWIDGGSSILDMSELDSSVTPIFGADVAIGIHPPSQGETKTIGAMKEWMITCQLGAEQYLGAEIQQLWVTAGFVAPEAKVVVIARPWGVPGYVWCRFQNVSIGSANECTASEKANAFDRVCKELLLATRCSMFVMEHHDYYTLNDVAEYKKSKIEDGETLFDVASLVGDLLGDDLYSHFKHRLTEKQVNIHSLTTFDLDKKQTNKKNSKTTNSKILFRVTCDRLGDHKFKSINVEREVGGAISEFYTNITPTMTDFQVQVRVDVVGHHVIIGTQQHLTDLSRRIDYAFRNRVTIKANMAHVMLRVANIQPGSVVCDPFCGSGTILMEAADWLKGNVTCIGLDVNRKAIVGARENILKNDNMKNSCTFYCKDARALKAHIGDNSLDAIVTNVPWGVQTGKNVDLQAIYEIVLRTAWYCLKPGGRFVMLVLRGLQMMRILRKLSGRYKLLGIRVVRTTNNMPCVVVVEKLERDVVHESLKGQLYEMTQYVNISPEMYSAVHLETTQDLDITKVGEKRKIGETDKTKEDDQGNGIIKFRKSSKSGTSGGTSGNVKKSRSDVWDQDK